MSVIWGESKRSWPSSWLTIPIWVFGISLVVYVALNFVPAADYLRSIDWFAR